MISIKEGRKRAKVLLSERFQEAIDHAAMRGNAVDTDAYLEDWRSVDAEVEADNMDDIVKAAAETIENSFDDERLKAIIKNQGYEA